MSAVPQDRDALARENQELRGQRDLLEIRLDGPGTARELARLRLALLDGLRTLWTEATGTDLPPDIHARFWFAMEHRGVTTMNSERLAS